MSEIKKNKSNGKPVFIQDMIKSGRKGKWQKPKYIMHDIGARRASKAEDTFLELIYNIITKPDNKIAFIKTYEDFEKRAKAHKMTYNPYFVGDVERITRDVFSLQIKNLQLGDPK